MESEFFSENLKKIRQELGLSVAKFADRLDMSANTLTNYERNTRTPSLELFVQLDKKLNVNLNWLVSGKGDMFNANADGFEQAKKDLLKEVKKMLKDEGIIK